MPPMAKKKPGRPATGESPTYKLFARIDPVVGEAYEAYIDSLPHEPRRRSLLEDILKEYLQPRGFWPPPPTNAAT